MPNYLRFVRGLIDSNDLPLNVSREILQDSSVTRNLRTALTKRALQMLDKLARQRRKISDLLETVRLVLKEVGGKIRATRRRSPNLLRHGHRSSSAQTVSLESTSRA